VNSFAELQHRFQNRLTLDQPRFVDRYVKLKLHLLVRYRIDSIDPETVECVVGDGGDRDRYGLNTFEIIDQLSRFRITLGVNLIGIGVEEGPDCRIQVGNMFVGRSIFSLVRASLSRSLSAKANGCAPCAMPVNT
jgi:hypothetical protein